MKNINTFLDEILDKFNKVISLVCRKVRIAIIDVKNYLDHDVSETNCFDIDMTEKNSELFEAIKRYKIAQKNFDNCNNDFFADANAELTAAKMHLDAVVKH